MYYYGLTIVLYFKCITIALLLSYILLSKYRFLCYFIPKYSFLNLLKIIFSLFNLNMKL